MSIGVKELTRTRFTRWVRKMPVSRPVGAKNGHTRNLIGFLPKDVQVADPHCHPYAEPQPRATSDVRHDTARHGKALELSSRQTSK